MTKGTERPPGSERMVRVGGADHRVDTLGDPADPAILLAGHSLWWEDELCERLAAGSRFVVRYDRRDTGRSASNEIPGARLLTLERTGHELPRAGWDVVVPAVLEHTSGGSASADGRHPPRYTHGRGP